MPREQVSPLTIPLQRASNNNVNDNKNNYLGVDVDFTGKEGAGGKGVLLHCRFCEWSTLYPAALRYHETKHHEAQIAAAGKGRANQTENKYVMSILSHGRTLDGPGYSLANPDEATKRVAAEIAAMTQEQNDGWNRRNRQVMDWLSR
jgi:hypothetical protein